MKLNIVLGTELNAASQQEALRRFVHRFTRDHVPQWARNGKCYPVQFASDQDWLAHTFFSVTKAGKLNAHHLIPCESRPTWPDNPELRRAIA
jgi:hypothetical protein